MSDEEFGDLNRFDNIVKGVSDKDRKKIISRVEEMDLPDLEDDEMVEDNISFRRSEVYDADTLLDSNEFKKLMQEGLDSLTFFEKLVFHIQTFFLRKNQAELFREHYINHLKQEVLALGNFANFTTKMLTSRFASELLELYRIVLPLKAPLDFIWQNKNLLHDLITYLLDQGNSSVKRSLEDFVSIDQMLNIFLENNSSDEAVRRHILKSVKGYTDSLSGIRLNEIRTELLPFFYLYKLTSYPFFEVFKIFGVSPSQITELSNSENLNFKVSVPASILLDYLIKLDSALSWSAHLKVTDSSTYYLYRVYLLHENKQISDGAKVVDIDSIARNANDLSREFNGILSKINRFYSRLPVCKLIQIFTKNPTYATPKLTAKLDIRKFYSDTFKRIAVSELDSVLVQMRIAYFRQTLRRIFEKGDYSIIDFYCNNFSSQWQKLGLPQFKHTKSFELVYNFLRHWVSLKMHNVFSLLITNILVKVPSLQSQMEEFKIAIDLAEDKIKKFDKSLGFDHESGKLLWGYKDSLDRSGSLKRTKDISDFIFTQDKEALALIDAGVQVLNNFSSFIKNKILEGTIESLKPIIAGVYGSISRSQSLQEVLRIRADDIGVFVGIIKEIIKYEKNSTFMGDLVVIKEENNFS